MTMQPELYAVFDRAEWAALRANTPLTLADADLDGSDLDELLGELLSDTQRRDSMALAARSVAMPDAADRVVDLILRHAAGRCDDVRDA